MVAGCTMPPPPTDGLPPMEARIQMIHLLLWSGANINALNESGRTPLSVAAERGEEPIVRELLTSGADIAVKDSIGKTPEDYAKAGGRTAVATLLANLREAAEKEAATRPNNGSK